MRNRPNIKKENTRLKKIAKEIRLRVLETVTRSNGPHIGSSLSAVEILTSLYFGIMKVNPNNPNRDRFILSKGHAAAVLYATLAERGLFNKKDLKNYCKNESNLPGHSTKNCVPGVEVSAGSLGHGLPIGNGMALAGKKDKKNYRIFVLLSDGECDEGSTWEAILFAGHHKLDNLVAIVDYNKWQSFGRTKDVLDLEPFAQKWRDFKWGVKSVDGHDLEELVAAFKRVPFSKNKPSVIIANTIKGRGLPAMENTLESHYRSPTGEEFEAAVRRLK